MNGTPLRIGFTVFGLLHVLATALISPPSANRALPVRMFVAVMWIAWGAVTYWAAIDNKEGELMFFWMVPSIIVLAAALLIAITENELLSARVRQTIPRFEMRRLALLFYSGPAGGIIWL